MAEDGARAELIIAGIGGMGVLVAGRLLASAGLHRYRHVSWMPSYGEARRGGTSECTVVLSDHEIASPILDQAGAVMLLDGSQLKAFESRVRPQGTMIAERAGLRDEPDRRDFTLVLVDGLDIAMSLGGVVVNNLILLGFYTELVKTVPPELIEAELEKQYAGRETILGRNKEAFRRGLELGRKAA